MKISYVVQSRKWNCGSACLGMIFDMSCEDVEDRLLKRAPEENFGVTAFEICSVLFKHGRPCLHWFPREAFPKDSWTYDNLHRLITFPSEKAVGDGLLDGRAAILGVSSKNIPDGSHWIMVAGRRVYDPAWDNHYTWEEVPFPVSEAVLLGDWSGVIPV